VARLISHNSPTAPIKAARFLVQRENRINVHARALPYRPLPIRPLWPPASASPPPDQHASGEFNATPSRATGRGGTARGGHGAWDDATPARAALRSPRVWGSWGGGTGVMRVRSTGWSRAGGRSRHQRGQRVGVISGAFGSLHCVGWLSSWRPGSHGPVASEPGSRETQSSSVSREPGRVPFSAREGTSSNYDASNQSLYVARGEPAWQCCRQPINHLVHASSLVRSRAGKQTCPSARTGAHRATVPPA
jgi:hypothetical protein